MIVSALIASSLRKIGGLSSGETIETDRQAEALSALQSMLRAWSQKRIIVFASVSESFTLVSGTASYSWGSGGTIATTRPHQVIRAFVRDSESYDHPVRVITEGEYKVILSKTTRSRPDRLFYYSSYPLGAVYLFPTPDANETLWMDTLKPFTETSSFATVNDTLSFPPNYEEPIIYNLAIRLAPEYGKVVSKDIYDLAKEGYNNLVALNSARQVEPIHLILPVGDLSRYNINTDGMGI